MDGMQNSVGAALTFSYTPAEIQGLAEPAQPGTSSHGHGHLPQMPGSGIQLASARPGTPVKPSDVGAHAYGVAHLRRKFCLHSRSRGLVTL